MKLVKKERERSRRRERARERERVGTRPAMVEIDCC